jgi:hypothetical protein
LLDGVVVASAVIAGGFLDSPSTLKFGHRGNPEDTPGSQDDSDAYLDGRIDEVQLYQGTPLSDSDIGELADCSPPGAQLAEVCHVNAANGRLQAIAVSADAVGEHLAHGDLLPGAQPIPAGATFTASSQYLGHTPANAFDGNPGTGWNAGSYPEQWIEVDFGSPQRFSTIHTLVDQFPLTGTTHHDITLDGVLTDSWSGETNHREWLTAMFGDVRSAQVVRITTTDSPSWVAWFEIQFWASC